MSSPSRCSLGLLVLVGGLIFFAYFIYLGQGELFEPDEVRYGEIAREMLESGDLITPRLNYVKYFEKPPFFYWLTSLFLKISGKTALSLRLPGAILALIGILIVFWEAQKLAGSRIGWLSALILGSSVGYYLFSQLAIIDMTMTVLLTGAMFLFLPSVVFGKRSCSQLTSAWLLLGLATLSKGPIVLILAFWAWGLYSLITRDFKAPFRVFSGPGLLVYAIVTVPWFFLVSLINREFFSYYFIHEHIHRFLGQGGKSFHQEPFWFFIPVFAGFFLPWTFFIPAACCRINRFRGTWPPELSYLAAWGLGVLSFFSISSGKLTPYILPCLPPLAINLAWLLDDDSQARSYLITARCLGIIILLSGLGLGGYWLFCSRPAIGLGHPGFVVAAGILAGAVILLVASRKPTILLAGIALTMLIYITLVVGWVRPALGNYRSTRKLAQAALLTRKGDEPFFSYNFFAHGFPFYTEQRLILINSYNELRFGSKQEAETGWFLNQEEWDQMVSEGRKEIIVVSHNDAKDCRKLQSNSEVKFKAIAKSGETVLFRNQPLEREDHDQNR